MAVEVVMPKLGMAMKEGIISSWNKRVGDKVTKGEPVASINSEKIEMEVEAPSDGVLLDIKVEEEEGVPPGTVICYIGEPNEQIAQKKEKETKRLSLSSSKEEVAATVAIEERPIKKNRLKISPVAKKIALASGLDIDTIQGSGPGGRITKADVEKELKKQGEKEDENREEARGEQTKIPLAGMRKVIAERMQSSLLNSAQLTITMKADVTNLVKLREEAKQSFEKRGEEKLSLNDFIVRATVLALGKHREMNSSYDEDGIIYHEGVHVGIAVAIKDGLLVPVVRNAEKLSLVETATTIRKLSSSVRRGEMDGIEMTGSTFTVTNLGTYGVEFFTPILNPPETGILGVGAIEQVPMYKGAELQKCSMLPLSLTFDHRVVDGAPAAEFLQTIRGYLEDPIAILL
ncbi:dihydrolipoamide acetyltransferase family protein [Priestia endophytica]|jgi:pyruvate dehydrogenase E2 component (dihydrolipoamide acetyltransferase)|uniref:Dihydrolipoamide acetyltransferase component of pyruvate dehydrogenase complex n=1 Tax=Priestia endophytica TaxID=135735 RepID=A0AAX1Q4C8_9BACI|nr:dihydrolipoamide acetyltransferase family protein [Priestia endophytica]MCM3537582.1 2-oxo acid dehydrogenase subunit E2 [Priestia endophytica]RAS73453.1 branched-chain alpha-keto acid dehydrogenase subunit E2 [Priestia endophytica]RAS90621.1 branched-chain alpha-keto acid dehydrogenase subunit E2 [Priestia endophytica]